MEENKFITFLKTHSWKISGITLSILILALFFGRSFFAKNDGVQDFVTIHSLFEKGVKGEMVPRESLELAASILKRHPELHATYDPLLIHNCLAQNREIAAYEYAKEAIEQSSDIPSHYKEFALNSLLIMKGELAESLENAQKLESALQKESASCELLRAYNLLRLAFLAKKLNKIDLQKEFVSRFETLKNSGAVTDLFHEGTLSWKDYFEIEKS